MNLILSLLMSVSLAGQVVVDEDPAVESGRNALTPWFQSYPWYDSANDAARPIDVSPPWYKRLAGKFDWLWNWKWPFRGTGRMGNWNWFPSSYFMWAAWFSVFILLGVITYLMIRSHRRRAKQRVSVQEAAVSDKEDERRRVEALPLPARTKPTDLLDEAKRHYEEGRYTQAVIFLFSHQLVELDRNHFIRLKKGKTNRQYVRELGQRTSLRSILGQTMVLFEDAFFGNYTIERAQFEACWSKLYEFDTLVGRGAV